MRRAAAVLAVIALVTATGAALGLVLRLHEEVKDLQREVATAASSAATAVERADRALHTADVAGDAARTVAGTDVSSLRREISELEGRVERLEADGAGFVAEIEFMSAQLIDLPHRIAALETSDRSTGTLDVDRLDARITAVERRFDVLCGTVPGIGSPIGNC